MFSKRFEYQKKDLPFLRHDTLIRLFFVVGFVCTFVLQFVLIVINYIHFKPTMLDYITGSIAMVASLVLSVLSIGYALKNVKNIGKIKRDGVAISQVATLPNIRKNSFARLYLIVTRIIAIIMLIILSSVATLSVLRFIYYAELPLYLPLIMAISFAAFNTAYHVANEINLVQIVEEYNGVL